MKPASKLLSVLVLSIGFTHATAANADITPANIFADHMVLQRDLPVPIWGSAAKDSTVTLEFDGQTIDTKADGKGRWKLSLKPMKASATGREMVIRGGDERIVLKDVLVGEVWFTGGQSNMAYTAGQMAKRLPEGDSLMKSANLPGLRFRKINDGNRPTPADDLKSREAWTICSPQSVSNHSAVAFVFARRLHDELKVPIGIIDCSWGGTPIEPYIPVESFTGHPTLEKLAALAKANDIDAIKAMPDGTFVRSPAWLPGAIYNGRIAPVAPYAIRGAIWYQGESNCGTGEDPRDYAHKMRALIKGWRSAFEQKDLPFYFVQLPQWNSYAWTYLRQEQRAALDMEHTGLVVTIDLDNAGDIHPPNKIDVGTRLARWPLAKVYARDLPVSGPLFRDATVHDNSIIITFDHADSGLMVGRLEGVNKVSESTTGVLHGFEVTGDDGQWREAEAVIKEQSIVVSSRQVSKPVAARYACHPHAEKERPWNLYNKAGLPASPFCSDWKRMPYDPARNPMPR